MGKQRSTEASYPTNCTVCTLRILSVLVAQEVYSMQGHHYILTAKLLMPDVYRLACNVFGPLHCTSERYSSECEGSFAFITATLLFLSRSGCRSTSCCFVTCMCLKE